MPISTSEAADLEAAKAVIIEMRRGAQADLDTAQIRLAAAKADRGRVEAFGNSLARAGVGGSLTEALAARDDAVDAKIAAAQREVAAADTALKASDRALDELKKHEDAGDRLRATGGAATATSWYGARPKS